MGSVPPSMIRAILQSQESQSDQKSKLPQIPNNFICPITGQLMKNPVINQVGQSYEKQAIQHWFSTGKKKDPKTNVQLKSTKLIPNVDLRNAIEEFTSLYIDKKNDKKKKSSNFKNINVFVVTFNIQKQIRKHKQIMGESSDKATKQQIAAMKCPNNHKLKRYSNGGRKYTDIASYSCNQCERKKIEDDDEFFYCNQCDYDLCLDCKQL